MNEGPGIFDTLFVLIIICIVVSVTSLLHESGACYVGKAAWLLGNPC